MLHEYHVTYSVRYYPRFHVTAAGLETYYPRIKESAFYFPQNVPPALETDDKCSAANSLYNSITISVGSSVTEF